MKTCAICKRELPTSIDEYGPIEKVVCQECFLDPAKHFTPDEERIKELEDEIEDLEGEIEDAEDEVRSLRKALDLKEDELEDIRNNGQVFEITPSMIYAWTAGLPKVVA